MVLVFQLVRCFFILISLHDRGMRELFLHYKPGKVLRHSIFQLTAQASRLALILTLEVLAPASLSATR